ncbi:hypothetical protein UFOVP736_30 [uncultured Caudovirales phage]|uniref:Uncharacterized protein n=1 Tax=uncultured Caudovirales phage TaxID=2100421 RepID=A0A6J7X1J1_9CAUD|nr:hypothetical protein UFOVP705_51 [uncultured Caudovirales phage]CAB5224075.1 hypothetical protein UFOVP736_30 [uncultured Caudovirales phage]
MSHGVWTCRNGLANRVNLLVQCLCEGGGEVGWPLSDHCSLRADDLFPGGIPGIRFTEQSRGQTCYQVSHADAAVRRQAAAVVYEAYLPSFRPVEYAVVIFIRRLLQERGFVLKDYLQKTGRALQNYAADEVKLQMDLPAPMAARWLGRHAVRQRCQPLRHDLDRADVNNQRLLAMDLKELWAARRVMTPGGRSTMVDMREHLRGAL